MNIIHFVFSMARGGQEKLIMDLALYQKSKGHSVSVLCVTTKEGPFAEALELKGIPVHAYGKAKGFSFSLIKQLKQEFRSRQATILHTHNPVPNFYGAIAAKWAGVPVVINTRHGMGKFRPNWSRERVFKFSQLFTHKVVFVCEMARERFVAQGIVKEAMAQAILNGVPLEQYAGTSDTDKVTLKQKLGLDPNTRVVGIIARMEPIKDISTFLQAAGKVHEKKQECQFLIVGAGSLMESLKQQAADLGLAETVYFLGDRRDVSDLLHVMDIFCLTSVSEGMPLTLIEAMASAKSIVATKVGGVPEVVAGDETGYLRESGDSKGIAQAILDLLINPEKMKRMGEAGRKRAFDLFHVKTMADQYQQLYEKILKQKNKP